MLLCTYAICYEAMAAFLHNIRIVIYFYSWHWPDLDTAACIGQTRSGCAFASNRTVQRNQWRTEVNSAQDKKQVWRLCVRT